MSNLIFYCDGASRNNGNKIEGKEILGSYGCVLKNEKGKVLMKSKRPFKDVTNNQMELLGFIQPITYFINTFINDEEEINIKIVSDSQYLIKGITEWLPGWKKKNWKNSSNQIIKNFELWKSIDRLLSIKGVNYKFEWVKGHSETNNKKSHEYFNNMCDKLANEAIDEYYDNKKIYSLNEDMKKINEVLLNLV